MAITPLFAAIFAVIYVALSASVIRHRFGKKVSMGNGEDKDLEKAVRIHGNFCEYVPFALLLMWFIEVLTFHSGFVFILGCVLLLARLAHVIGMRDPKNYLLFRQAGIIATFLVLLLCAGRLIWHYLPIM
jgi:uncharacterized membrane protein YecN with MAPEG domain